LFVLRVISLIQSHTIITSVRRQRSNVLQLLPSAAVTIVVVDITTACVIHQITVTAQLVYKTTMTRQILSAALNAAARLIINTDKYDRDLSCPV